MTTRRRGRAAPSPAGPAVLVVFVAVLGLVTAWAAPGRAQAGQATPTAQTAQTAQTTRAAAATAAAGSTYVPVTPTRIYSAVVGPGVHPVPIAGASGTQVPADATSVVLNITATASSSNTYVTVYPASSAAPPRTSVIDIAPGQSNADLVTVPVGDDGAVNDGVPDDGAVDLYQPGSGMRLLVDVQGYYVVGSSGDLYVPRAVVRAYDVSGVKAGSTTTVSRATLRVPDDAAAVVLDLGVTGGTADTYLTAYPATSPPSTRPVVSALDVAHGTSRTNLAVVPLGAAGIDVYNYVGTATIFGDVAGWYVPDRTGATGSTFVPQAPDRIVGGARLGAGAALNVQVSGSSTPSGATAAVFTLTAANATAPTYETEWVAGSARPATSAIDAAKGSSVPNLIVTPLSSGGAVSIYNYVGTVGIDVDVVGWFVPVPTGHDVSYPQCSDEGTGTGTSPSPLPATAFGIINPSAGGLAGSGASPCLAAQDSWASASGDEAFYLPLVDHGSSSTLYETPGTAPKACAADETAAQFDANPACAYDYGWNQAASLYGYASSTGHENVGWWLDVENQTDSWSDASTAKAMAQSQNIQVITGAHDYLAAQSVAGIGLYSNSDDVSGDLNWPAIVGSTTAFASYPEWVSTHASAAYDVVAACSTPFAGGAVTLVQDAGASVDDDDAC